MPHTNVFREMEKQKSQKEIMIISEQLPSVPDSCSLTSFLPHLLCLTTERARPAPPLSAASSAYPSEED